MRFALLGLLLFPVFGCGLAPSQASCDGRPKEQSCTDLLTNRNNHLEPTLDGLCAGTFSTSLCNHTGALGGCRCESCENGVAVQWLFPDPGKNLNTVDDVKKACGTRTFVAP